MTCNSPLLAFELYHRSTCKKQLKIKPNTIFIFCFPALASHYIISMLRKQKQQYQLRKKSTRSSKMTFQTEQWYLKQQFLIADMDRIDHEDYFSESFLCPDLDTFISEMRTAEQAYQNKTIMNMFFDRLISSGSTTKSVYVRIKWVAYIHKLIREFKQESVMHGLMLKALQVYVDRCDIIYRRCFQADSEGGQEGRMKGTSTYERYFFKTLLKPYIQYLIKLLLLSFNVRGKNEEVSRSVKDFSNKENAHPSALNREAGQKVEISTTHSLNTTSALNATGISAKNIFEDKTAESLTTIMGYEKYTEDHLTQWYRSYNFILSTLESFTGKLNELQPFFGSELPYLCNIRQYISKDLKQQLRVLKNTCISLNDLNMTMIELDELETNVRLFSLSKSQQSIFDINESILCTGIEDYTKEDITNFMCSPFKAKNNTLNLSDTKSQPNRKPHHQQASRSVGAVLAFQ